MLSTWGNFDLCIIISSEQHNKISAKSKLKAFTGYKSNDSQSIKFDFRGWKTLLKKKTMLSQCFKEVLSKNC